MALNWSGLKTIHTLIRPHRTVHANSEVRRESGSRSLAAGKRSVPLTSGRSRGKSEVGRRSFACDGDA